MNTFVQLVLDAFHLVCEYCKGPRVVSEIVVPMDQAPALTGFSVMGYEIRLFVQRRAFITRFHRWWVMNNRIDYYRVYSTVTLDAPPCMREACRLDITIPVFPPVFVSESLQKESAVQAYLDILIERLKENPLMEGCEALA